jgi:hypothetical protein
MQPASCAIYELLGLQCDPDTQKVYNPLKGEARGWNSDDTAEVIVHTHKLVQHMGYSKRYDDRTKRTARRRAEAQSREWNGGQVARLTRFSGSMGGRPHNWNKGRGW